jgi:hypothetical protein
MSRKPLLLALAAVALVMVSFTAAHADNARVSWRHDAGHFEQVAGGKWVETSPTPHSTTYHFEEQSRTADFVQLYDAGRDCHVRLYNDHCLVKFGDGRYEEYYTGKWANR